MSSVSSEYNKRNFQAIIHIGTKLLKDSPKASDISEESTDNPCAEFMDVSAKFLIYYDVADAYRIYQDLSQSVYFYKKAYKILQQYSISDLRPMTPANSFIDIQMPVFQQLIMKRH